jgi:hypothetical protein
MAKRGGVIYRRQLNVRAAPLQVGFAHRQRQLAQIIATFREDVEGTQLHFVVMPAGMQRIEI